MEGGIYRLLEEKNSKLEPMRGGDVVIYRHPHPKHSKLDPNVENIQEELVVGAKRLAIVGRGVGGNCPRGRR